MFVACSRLFLRPLTLPRNPFAMSGALGELIYFDVQAKGLQLAL